MEDGPSNRSREEQAKMDAETAKRYLKGRVERGEIAPPTPPTQMESAAKPPRPGDNYPEPYGAESDE